MSENCLKNLAPAYYKKLFVNLMDTKYTIINNNGLHCIYFVFNAVSDSYMKNLGSDFEVKILLVLMCCSIGHKIQRMS